MLLLRRVPLIAQPPTPPCYITSGRGHYWRGTSLLLIATVRRFLILISRLTKYLGWKHGKIFINKMSHMFVSKNHFCRSDLFQLKVASASHVYIWPFMFRRLKKYWGWHKSKLKGNSFSPPPPPTLYNALIRKRDFPCLVLNLLPDKNGTICSGCPGDPHIINIREIFW